jgi:hypothetical protein
MEAVVHRLMVGVGEPVQTTSGLPEVVLLRGIGTTKEAAMDQRLSLITLP